jgi:glycosyltransferase involved in cell wall biosynthesis
MGRAGAAGVVPVMRVYSRLDVGGIEHQMLKVLTRLDPARYRVSVCLIKRPGVLADWFRREGIPVHVLPFQGRFPPGGLWRMSRLFRENGIRIVHAHVRESNTSATVAARMARVPIVIGSIHNVDTIRGRRRILQDRLVDRWRDAMVAVSKQVKQNYCRTVGVDPAKVSVIYNGVDLSAFAGDVSRPEVLGPLGVPPGDKVVICVARLAIQKAHETLLEAAAVVLRSAPRTTFLIVGDGPRLPDLRREAERLGIGPKVVFAGRRDDIPALLKASDVSTLSSTREGFSNVVIESFAAGLPVVATDVGGNAEAIEEGESGFLVPSGDATALADRLLRVVTDAALQQRLSAAARRRATRFSLEETVRAIESLYERLLEARGMGRAAAVRGA